MTKKLLFFLCSIYCCNMIEAQIFFENQASIHGVEVISGLSFFGLGSATDIDYIKVTWLSGVEGVLSNININETISIVEGSILSAEEYNTKPSLTYYPNPVSQNLVLQGLKSVKSITIYNVYGQLLYGMSPNELIIEIDMSRFSSGAYFMDVDFDNNDTKRIKILKD